MKKNIWIEDEYIFSLHLYHLVKNKIIKDSKDDPNFKEQYRIFQQIQKQNDLPDRSLNSLYLRVQNWKSIDPNWNGKGMDGADKNLQALEIFSKFKNEKLLSKKIKNIYEKYSKSRKYSTSNNCVKRFRSIIKENTSLIINNDTIRNIGTSSNVINFEVRDEDKDLTKFSNYIIYFEEFVSSKYIQDKQIKIKKKSLNLFIDNIIKNIENQKYEVCYCVLYYNNECKTFTSVSINELFKHKELSFIVKKEEFIHSLDYGLSAGLVKNASEHENSFVCLTFKSDYIGEFLIKYSKKFIEQLNTNIICHDNLNVASLTKFSKMVIKLHSQDFRSTKIDRTKDNILNIRKFINVYPLSNSHEQKQSIVDISRKILLTEKASKLHHSTLVKIQSIMNNLGIEVYEDPNSFDLFFKMEENGYLFEVKSINSANFIDQTRSAVSQLLEYSHLFKKALRSRFNTNDIKLCIVYHESPFRILEDEKVVNKYFGFLNSLNILVLYPKGEELLHFCNNREVRFI